MCISDPKIIYVIGSVILCCNIVFLCSIATWRDAALILSACMFLQTRERDL